MQPYVLETLTPLELPTDTSNQWTRWKGKTIAILMTSALIGGRACNHSLWTDAICDFGIGFGLQMGVDQIVGDRYQVAHKIALTTLGQLPMFLLTLMYDNVKGSWKTIASSSIVGMLGAHIAMYANQFFKKHCIIRVESSYLLVQNEIKFTDIFLRENISTGIKALIASLCGWRYFLEEDPLMKGILSFGACFYGSEIIGEKLLSWLDKKIAETQDFPVGITSAVKSKSRMIKTGLNTIGFFAVPLSFIPFSNEAHSSQRISQLFAIGIVSGFFDGIMHRSLENRLQNIPLCRLEELQINSPIRNRAYVLWEVVFPILTISALVSFAVWLEGWVIDVPINQAAIALMISSFMITFISAEKMDRSWSLESRMRVSNPTITTFIKDKVFTSFLIDPRFLGMNPAYIFFVGTNALSMNDAAIKTDRFAYQMIALVSWTFFGIAMGVELQRTKTRRRGTVFQFPMMAVINGALTFQRLGSGKIR